MAKLLFVPDLHKRDADFSTISGFTQAIDAVQSDLLALIRREEITHVISLGDWYDRGYHSINRLQHDRNVDEEIKKAVNGNFYLCIGNHFFTERDNNPELYMIQPSARYAPVKPVFASSPIAQTPDYFMVDGVQVSLFHFNKEDKAYLRPKDPSARYHIGVYHDDTVAPNSIRKELHLPPIEVRGYLEGIYENIDLAILGHIHNTLGTVRVHTDNREIPLVIPGALAITQNKACFIHSSVKLPMVTTTANGSITYSEIPQSLHTELLTFHQGKEAKTVEQACISPLMAEGSLHPTTLREFMQNKGYSNNIQNLIVAASQRALELGEVVTILGGNA